MEIRVLGPLGVFESGRQLPLGGRRQRSVLAGLVVHVGETVSTETLIDLVWGETPPPSARKSLQTYVSRLRHVLGDGAIGGTPEGYVLRAGPDGLDALRFEALAARGRELLDTDAAAAWEVLSSALALWRGTPFADVEMDGDLLAVTQRLQELRLATLEARIDAGLAIGQHALLIGELRSLTESHPLRERLWEQLVLALARSGRRGEALETYERCRRALARELGLDPSARLQGLQARLLRPGPEVEHTGVTPASGTATADPRQDEPGPLRNPYKGLRSFSEADAEDFFGREALVDELVARIGDGARFLALVGPSGSGKSSVALAGLVPALRETPDGRRLVARMSPGSHPFAQLEAALARAAHDARRTAPALGDDDLALLRAALTVVPDERTELLLVIDQFEELLTGVIARATVRSFLRNLVEALEDPHGQLLVVVTLRSDFLDQAMRQPDLAELLTAGAVHVPPLTAVELQAAVVRPARAVGLVIEPELVAELVSEATQHPGALPLLQFVLTELTEDAEGGILTLAALREAGGVHGMLARRAEELYASSPGPSQEAMRLLLLRLVALKEGGEPTRRVVVLDELQLPGVGQDTRREVLEALGAGRLLTYGRDALSGLPTVEVAHEAVLAAWPRCAGWIAAATADIRLTLDLERAAADWVAADRSADYLLTGSRLRQHEERARTSEVSVTPSGEAFLAASIERRDREHEAEAARAAHERNLERRAANRSRAAIAVLALLVAVTSVLTAIAAARGNDARRQQDAALSAVGEILVRQLSYAAITEAGRDPELGLLLALHAVRVAGFSAESVRGRRPALPRETVEALHWGLQERRVPYPIAEGEPIVLTGQAGPRGAYDLPVEQLVTLAQEHVDRELTPQECGTFLPGHRCPSLPDDLAADLPAFVVAWEEVAKPLENTSVRLAGPVTDEYAAALREEFAEFTARTGIEIVYTEGTSTFEGEMERGEPQRTHDIIMIPQPGWVPAEATAGRLVDLGIYLPRGRIVEDYGAHLTSLVTVGDDGGWPAASGGLRAVPAGVGVKSLIWYVPERFAEAGYSVPTTWEELLALSDRIVADGGTPWCLALGSGKSTGWPLTDLIEDLLLHEAGPEVYDAWVAAELPFAHPAVRRAFERAGELTLTAGYVHGGVMTALNTPFWGGHLPLLDDPPRCWLYHWPSFNLGNLPLGVEFGRDIATFPTPSLTEEHREVTLMSGELALVYTDRPEVRAVVQYLASPAFGEVAAGAPWFLASNRRFDTDNYPDEWRRDLAEDLARAQDRDLVRFDGSDLMPPWLGTHPFWEAMVDYLRGGPESLDAVLAGLDALVRERS
jgi:DNA-binding SARP family transcriptional activator/ABC-type glycerol-3-phosphate transport system substrate-binding protein